MPESPLDLIRSIASKYPEAEKTFLFGDHEVFRVRRKVYVWLGRTDGGGTYLSVKLKDSQHAAMMLPFVSPASYGMAKWGWIAAEFPRGKLPRELVAQWIDESYRHTAPKRLVKQLDANATALVTEPRAPRVQVQRRRSSAAPARKRRRMRPAQPSSHG
jgi:predicted DNA-binding protein (MmcQ/YjbR family)